MTLNYFLKGENIFLNRLEANELKKLCRLITDWVNDGVVTYFMFTGQKPQNYKQVFNDFKKQLDAGGNIIFLIGDCKTKKLIGYAGLYDINYTSRKAEFRILIGEKAFWGKGYGTEVTELVTFYGFDRLNLNRIYLGYTASNKRAGWAYGQAGYVCEGTLKEDIFRNSRYYDSIRMAILRKNYYKKFYKSHSKRFKQDFPK